jgi:hypothetical protein
MTLGGPHFLRMTDRKPGQMYTGYEPETKTEIGTHLDLLSRLLVALDLGHKLGSLVDPIRSRLSNMVHPDRFFQQLSLFRSQVVRRRSRRLDRSLLDHRRFRRSALGWCGYPIDVRSGRARMTGRVTP